jgi:hypothetical protein
MTLLYMGLALFVMGCVSLYIISRRKFHPESQARVEMSSGQPAPVTMSMFERRVRIGSAASLVLGGLILVALSYAAR